MGFEVNAMRNSMRKRNKTEINSLDVLRNERKINLKEERESRETPSSPLLVVSEWNAALGSSAVSHSVTVSIEQQRNKTRARHPHVSKTLRSQNVCLALTVYKIVVSFDDSFVESSCISRCLKSETVPLLASTPVMECWHNFEVFKIAIDDATEDDLKLHTRCGGKVEKVLSHVIEGLSLPFDLIFADHK